MNNKKTKKQLNETLKNELRKQGINPDMIGEYGDVYSEDFIDDYSPHSRVSDSWDEYGDDDY